MVHVHRDRPPAGDPVGYIRLLGRIFLSGCSRGGGGRLASLFPILFVSWFFHLERTDPVGWESLERVASSSFPTGR